MTLLKLNPNACDLSQGSLLSIGNFDGVHLGHQALCLKLNQLSQTTKLPSVVLIFEPQAKEFFANPKNPQRILSLREKIFCLKELGIDYVFCLDFNHKIANMTADAFLQDIMMHRLNARHLVLGRDFHFGRNRQGNPDYLNQAVLKYGCQIDWLMDAISDGHRISSTTLRNHLKTGDLQASERLMGRPYFIIGRVNYGRQLAGTWGVPTANIPVFQQKKLLTGVFCVRIYHCASGESYNGIANLGYKPTLHAQKLLLEVHLFNFSGSLYGQELRVSFLHKLRDEQKFEFLTALKHQILEDVKAAKTYFENKD